MLFRINDVFQDKRSDENSPKTEQYHSSLLIRDHSQNFCKLVLNVFWQQSKNLHRISTYTLVILFVGLACAFFSAHSYGSVAKSSFTPSSLNISGPEISTDIAALIVRGNSRRETIEILDLDIIQNEDGQRLVPLLRILRALDATGSVEGDVVNFSIEPGVTIKLDLQQKSIHVKNQSTPLLIKTGLSDVTGVGEVYVHDRIFNDALGLNAVWSDNEYAYRIQTKKKLRVFINRQKMNKRSLQAIKQMTYNLPETEPARLSKDSRQFISFVEAGTRIDNRDSQPERETIVTPDVSIYGQMIGGNYYIRLTENINTKDSEVPDPALWLDKGLWTSKGDNFAIRVGDTSQGLGGLVVPSASFTGAVARGIFGAKNKKTANHFLSSSQFSFLSESSFNGYAPLGSTVEFYANNRLVDTQVVDDTQGAPPGQGRYDFVGVGLFGRSINDVKIVVRQPDGTVDEYKKTIAGSSNLLPSRQLAFSAGVGTKRREKNGAIHAEGSFGGVGVFYGLTEHLTLGFTAANQRNFFNATDSSSTRLPQRYYLGQSTTFRAFDSIVLNGEIAVNVVPDTSDRPIARDLSAHYWFDLGVLSLYEFDYDDGYSHGNIYLGGRSGSAAFNRLRLLKRLQLDTTFAMVTNSDDTQQESYLISSLSGPFILPRTMFSMRLDWLDKQHTEVNEVLNTRNTSRFKEIMYSVNLESNPHRRVNLSGEYAWGDSINPASEGQLWYGISVPQVGSVLSYGLRLQSKFVLMYNTSLDLTYRDNFAGTENAELNLGRMSRRKYSPGLALRHRYDIERDYNSSRLDFELPLDNRRRKVIGVGVEYNEITKDYRYNLFINFRELFFQDKARLKRVDPDWRVHPQAGGIKGFVYLDTNANGHYEPGEPGVPDVEVMLAGRRKAMTSDDGYFLFSRRDDEDEVWVSLNEKELSAIYTPTQGVQRAEWEEYIFTNVNLGVSVLSAITGKIAIWEGDTLVRGLPGAVVLLRKNSDNSIVKSSITDSEGLYYLGEVKPGDYAIEIDPTTVSPVYQIITNKTALKVRANLEMEDLEGIDFRIARKKVSTSKK